MNAVGAYKPLVGTDLSACIDPDGLRQPGSKFHLMYSGEIGNLKSRWTVAAFIRH